MPVIVPMQPAHVADCARIMAENALWQRHGVTLQDAMRRFSDGLQDADACMQVALIDDEVCGFIWYYRRGTFHSGGYIRLVGIANDAKGQGIGQMLMEVAETDISQHARDIFLLASDFNIGAHRFYRRLGYQSIGALPDFASAGITEMIFWKRLSQKGAPTPSTR